MHRLFLLVGRIVKVTLRVISEFLDAAVHLDPVDHSPLVFGQLREEPPRTLRLVPMGHHPICNRDAVQDFLLRGSPGRPRRGTVPITNRG